MSKDNDTPGLTSQCQQCVKMLTKVLLSDKSSSRALELLRALGNNNSSHDTQMIRETTQVHDNGVTVQLSDNTKTAPPKRLRRYTTTFLNSAQTSVENNLAARMSGMDEALATSPANSNSIQQQQEHDDDSMKLKIECRVCGNAGPEGSARAFVMGPNPLSVVLCSNRLSTTDEMDQVLIHELTHIYDVMRLKLDLRNCQELAYSEVRAARQAECYGFKTSFMKLPQNLCIQQKATIATQNLFPTKGRKCVSDVFQKAMADERPFLSQQQQEEEASRR